MTMISMGRETTRNGHFTKKPGLLGAFKIYLARSRAERQLNQLDDHMLADIGINRGEIRHQVWGR